MKRLGVSLIVALLCLFSIAKPSHALELTDSQAEAIRIAIADVLDFKESWFGEDVDVSLLEAGQPVPMYRHAKDGTVKMTFALYPIVYNGRYVAGCLEYPDGTMCLQKNTALLIQDTIDMTGVKSVAIVYEASGMHLTDGTVSTLIVAPDEPEVANRHLSATDLGPEELAVLDVADLQANTPLHYDGAPEGLQDLIAARERIVNGTQEETSRHNETQEDAQGAGLRLTANECSMDYVSQPAGSYICWAACMSMLYGFHGYSYPSASYVANYWHVADPDPDYVNNPIPGHPAFDYRREGDWVAQKLRVNLQLGNYWHIVETVYYSTIQQYIDYQYPIIGGWSGYTAPNVPASGGWHMNVIKGYDNYVIYLNDPLYGEDTPAVPCLVNGNYYWVYAVPGINAGEIVYRVQVADVRYV